jgi:hypothetical protein
MDAAEWANSEDACKARGGEWKVACSPRMTRELDSESGVIEASLTY